MMKKTIAMVLVCALLVSLGFGAGYLVFGNKEEAPVQAAPAGYAKNPAHEFLIGSAAWQMSAEAHALMMQGFNTAKMNIDRMAEMADNGEGGYSWTEENGEKKLYFEGKRVAVISDIDDTLVDGVHYTANILGKDGEWNNKAFTDFLLSEGLTALPGAVDFANYAVDHGLALFYVTNRYDQGYKTSEAGYAGQEGYKKATGEVIGSSTFDIFGKTIYDISMETMAKLGFPTNDSANENFHADACLIVNDTKLNGSSKEGVRTAVSEGQTWKTGERAHESKKYPEMVDLAKHHVALLLGDDLNDISQIFSDSGNDAVSRVALSIENIDKWGTQWIVFPNAVYGSAINFAGAYGYNELMNAFDYTVKDNEMWSLYKK